jgi:peptidoglycan-N-acetylglucosamine deacetylase
MVALFLVVTSWGAFFLRSGYWCKATWCGDPSSDVVALTYDDGPDPDSTPALLDYLESRGVRATFFCVGRKVTEHPALVERIKAEGHLVGNHSEHHSNWTNFYTPGPMLAEVGAAQESIANVLGERPKYYRPPVGLSNPATGRTAEALGLRIIGWQVRGFDLPGSRPERVARRILKRLRPGGIILLHDGARDAGLVVEVTRRVLDGIQERGLRAVPLDELLEA